jgi:hypothetical protein
MMRLAMTARHQVKSAEPSSFGAFPATFLVPEALLPDNHRYAFVVEPLHRAEEAIGIALLEMGPSDGSVYEVLRTQLTSIVAELEGARQRAADCEERHALLRKIVQIAEAVRRAHASTQQDQPPDPESSPSPGPDALLERLDLLVAECMSLSGEDMDTLRPGPLDPSTPDGEAGTAAGS